MKEKALFCICVMTFNRGGKALNLAQTLADQLDEQVQLLFMDNGSLQETEAYQQLQALSEQHPYIHYYRHPFNCGFNHNFLSCYRKTNAVYMMMQSDEDFANVAMIREVLPLLQQYPSVGVMRGSLATVEGAEARNSFDYADASFMAGEEAMTGFYMENNYFSGTIYHRDLLEEKGLIDMLANRIDDYGVAIYPHMYLELIAAAVSDVVTTSSISVFEGHEQALENNAPARYIQPYSFGSRIDQFIIMRNCLEDAVGLVGEPFDVALFATMYLKLCEKYLYLVSHVNADMYQGHQVHPGLLHQAMYLLCSSAISDYPELADYQSTIQAELQRLQAKYDVFA